MDDDVLHKPPERFDQRDDKRFSASKSSDEEEEEEDEVLLTSILFYQLLFMTIQAPLVHTTLFSTII